MAGAKTYVDAKLLKRKVLMFSKTHSPECAMAKTVMEKYPMSAEDFEIVEIEKRQDCTQIENYFQTICLTDARAVCVSPLACGGALDVDFFSKIIFDFFVNNQQRKTDISVKRLFG